MSDGMPMDQATRTLRALAAFRPEATMSELSALIVELRDALDVLAEVVKP